MDASSTIVEASPLDLSAARQQVLPLLSRLVSIPTWEGNTEANALRYLQEWLDGYGIRSELREEDGQVLALVARLGPGPVGSGKGEGEVAPLIFNSHVDTVPPSAIDQWKSDPFTLTRFGDEVVGLGATDAKGSVAAMVCAFAALHQDWPEDAAVELMIVGGEERGGLGSRMEARRGLAGAAIVGEPTSLIPAVGCKGAVRLEVVTRGKAAHASNPSAGVNAIYPMAALIGELEALAARVSQTNERWTGNASLAVTVIRGGTAHNVIPNECRIHVDRRLVPGEEAQTAEAQVEDIAASVAARYPDARIEVVRERQLEPVLTDLSERVVTVCREASPTKELTGFTACCDLTFITHIGGIPGVIWGPGPLAVAHQVNEALPLDELYAAVDAYYTAAQRWAALSRKEAVAT